MTSDIHRHRDDLWEQLFDLLYDCEGEVSDEQVKADLKKAKIDMRSANARLMQMVDEKRAQEEISRAPKARASALDMLRGILAPKIKDLRVGVQALIARVGGPEQAVFNHKLEKAATEQDLQSLMDDLHRLSVLRESEKKNERPAE
jgi:CO dehydrogenase/acetyl-CoA synthase gamma subunit (corrinoid Fe-S protein)